MDILYGEETYLLKLCMTDSQFDRIDDAIEDFSESFLFDMAMKHLCVEFDFITNTPLLLWSLGVQFWSWQELV